MPLPTSPNVPIRARSTWGFTPGSELEITEDELGIRFARVAPGPRLVLAGLIDFGPQSAPAQSLMHAVAEKRVASVATAWHCCLEFSSVATRLPAEFRVTPADAALLLTEEVFSRVTVHDLPSGERLAMLQAAGRDGVAGGRLYDSHITEVARVAGATVVVTDNRRHFVSALRYGMRVETPAEFLAGLKKTKRANSCLRGFPVFVVTRLRFGFSVPSALRTS